MILDNRDGTIVRGADGVLYVVSADTCQYADQGSSTESFFGEESIDVLCAGAEDDHASARALIDPGDHASARALIDPGDHASARALIDPGDHASARALIDPGDHARA